MQGRINKQLGQLSRLFWQLDPSKLDAQKDRTLIIHHVLAYGSLEDVKKLFKFYGLPTVRKEFARPQRGLYAPSVFELFRTFFGLKYLRPSNYVKHVGGAAA